jgi:lipopolysaccharide biosynthesis glycosyltransferase
MKNNFEKDITVVCASDNNYAMPLAVSVCSILKNLDSQRHLNLYILDGGISEKNKTKLKRSLNLSRCSIKFLYTKGRFQHMPLVDHLTEATYHRLLIPELLSNEIHKVIYLDCDLLVLKDISTLWDMDIGDRHLLAVQDYYYPYIKFGVKNNKELGIPDLCKYFNAGVLVMNLRKWREDCISAKVIEYIGKPRDYKIFNDQEALNAILWDKWEELEPKWNQQVILTNILEDMDWFNSLIERLGEDHYHDIASNPFIKHFVSPIKPWQSYKHPESSIFYQYLDLTAWKGWRYTQMKVLWNIFQEKMQRLFQNFKSLI